MDPVAQSSGGQTARNSKEHTPALCSITPDSWVYVNGVGGKKLADDLDSAIIAVAILAANAKPAQSAYKCRDEADGMIHETYV